MNVADFKSLAEAHSLRAVNFIESGCGPMVIEVEYDKDSEPVRELIKDSHGEVVTCKNVTQAYGLCQKAGVHKANLVQVIPHDEACQAEYADYHRESMPLTF
ncbi:hypothetical protein [Marinobacterium jannaschii]|uniref:hypothetical protein n=1 Tax=Marinobacterium jannaschii TaxID=64970 RepID=UPI00048A3859|nr:hypothetical protein [Marinobacterium jannaschii]